jgi:uncharacterized protein involved in exopolysaccharide biosynthesis
MDAATMLMAPDPRDRRVGRRETIDDEWPVGLRLEPIRRHKLLILLCAAFFLALGLVYLSVAPPRYTAVAELVIDPKRSHPPENEPRVENLIDIAVLESHLQIVKSEQLALAVIQNLSLSEDPEFIETGILGKVLEFVMRGWKVTNEKLYRALTKFKRSLNVRLLGRSYVIEIAFTSSSADKAARVANELATVYIQDQLEARVEQSRQSGNWLQDRIKSLREQMTNAFRHMEDLQAEHAASTREGHAKLRELEAEALTYKSMYEAFLNRYVQTVQQQSFPVTDARVVTEARPPLRPSSPDPLYTALLSLAAGLGFGSFVSFALAYRRAVRAPLGSIAREAELVSLSKSRIPQEVEEAILALAIERPALSELRILNELRKRGLMVSSAGVRWVLQQHDLETVNKRVKFKNAQKGLVLTKASPESGAESKTEKNPEPVNITADQAAAVAAGIREPDFEQRRKECGTFLVEELRDGPMLQTDIETRLNAHGFRRKVVDYAVDQLRVVKAQENTFQGKWWWSLPSEGPVAGKRQTNGGGEQEP